VATNILVVEDQRAVAGALRMRLRGLGYGVLDIAKDGDEAIEKAAELRPDLILMDIRLGEGIDGIEAARRIRSKYDIPVVYVTAYADHELLDRARETHPAGFINKPFTTKDLLTTINLALTQEAAQPRGMEQLRDAVLTTDQQGRVSFINHSAEQLTGWKRQQVLGRHLSEALRQLHGLPTDEGTRLIATVIASRRELLLPLPAGAPADAAPDVLAPLNDARGNLFGVALHFGHATVEAGATAQARALEACQFALDQTPFGVVVLDDALRVMHANAYARNIINVDADAVLTHDGGALHARDEQVHETLRHHVRNVTASATPGAGELIELGAGSSGAHVIGMVSAGVGAQTFSERPLALLFLFDLGHRQTLSATVLRQVYGLTRSEAKLVQTLVGGCSLEDGAQELGISVNTARTHLKHVFHKTGARRQSELIHQVETGPASLTLDIRHRRR